MVWAFWARDRSAVQYEYSHAGAQCLAWGDMPRKALRPSVAEQFNRGSIKYAKCYDT
ncbi:MAG: hypothetical protein IJS08_11815 [Victivallales bacterium]|nr:hypothetical protein [Victivallales bacterium]